MSDKPGEKDAPAYQPALARMLFAAIDEHQATLARIARLLHDEVSQVLSAVGLQLDAMRMDFRDHTPAIEQRAGEIQTMLEHVIELLRDVTNELNPSVVERAGLPFALDRLAGKLRENFSGILRLHCDPGARVPTSIAATFYKIAECAVTNSLGRPRCSLIEIQLKRSRGQFVLEVHDNGAVQEIDPGGLPLDRLLMDYHASKAQVTLEVTASHDKGTLVRASHPAQVE